jgi:hypothetical protein
MIADLNNALKENFEQEIADPRDLWPRGRNPQPKRWLRR